MATSTASHLKIQTRPNTNKPKRRRFRETTISSSAATATTTTTTTTAITTTSQAPPERKLGPTTVVSPHHSWCCPASNRFPPPPPPPPSPPLPPPRLPSDTTSNLKIEVMESTQHTSAAVNGGDSFPTSFTKFNSALTAGLLNPMSPPPTRSSPTLFEMMANEPDCIINPRPSHIPNPNHNPNAAVFMTPKPPQIPIQQRLHELLSCKSPGSQFNDVNSSDLKLNLSSRDGVSVSMNLHRQILVGHSRFFAARLLERRSRQERSPGGGSCVVEIGDCDDIEVYVETLRLMYCKDLRRRLMREDVTRVLGILKVSAAIGFDGGILSCLEYLEAAPWAEDEEEKVASLLSELRLEGVGAGEVLKRVSVDVTTGLDDGNDNEEVLLKLLRVVLEGKDEKARREMKGLVSKMLRENSSQNDLKKDSLYSACDGCLQLLRHHFLRAAEADLQDVGQIARQADNLHWILDIMIDRQIAEDFLKTWASQLELSDAHSKVPAIHRYEVSRVTSRLFVGIGKGHLLASKDARCLLLQTWLVPFYEDFGWMRRASKGLDRHLIEDGLSSTILTLPLAWQQEILMSWFDRFLNAGDDCPNIQRGFEVWWRRAFWRRKGEPEQPRQMRITTASIENS